MKAVVLGAGVGKRLGSVTANMPKVLLRVREKTLIEHNLDKLRKIGINDIAVVIGYKGEMVKEMLGNSVTYYKQSEQLGTAHALLCAEQFINDPIFLGINGDIFFTDSLTDFVKLKPPAVAVYHFEDTRRFGKMESKHQKLVRVREKTDEGGPGFINAGVYLFPKTVFELIKKTPLSPRKEYEITDTIQLMILFFYECPDYFILYGLQFVTYLSQKFSSRFNGFIIFYSSALHSVYNTEDTSSLVSFCNNDFKRISSRCMYSANFWYLPNFFENIYWIRVFYENHERVPAG
jgi:NDP-sugar pyrophosphorylase family protein